MKNFNSIKGKINEDVATKFLKKNKYKILERNYKNNIGEIDIIAEQKKVIVFIEVKYRQTSEFGLPREAVNDYKQNKIRKVATIYLISHGYENREVRFDVVDILGEEITLIKNAF